MDIQIGNVELLLPRRGQSAICTDGHADLWPPQRAGDGQDRAGSQLLLPARFARRHREPHSHQPIPLSSGVDRRESDRIAAGLHQQSLLLGAQYGRRIGRPADRLGAFGGTVHSSFESSPVATGQLFSILGMLIFPEHRRPSPHTPGAGKHLRCRSPICLDCGDAQKSARPLNWFLRCSAAHSRWRCQSSAH